MDKKRVAAHDSRGYNEKGDQDGTEVSVYKEYSSDTYTYLLRCKDSTIAAKAAAVGVKLANSSYVGYSRTNERYSLEQALAKYGYDVDKYLASSTPVNCDCSSFVTACYACFIPALRGKYCTTSTMCSEFKSTGLFSQCSYYNRGTELVGDVYVTPGTHTTMQVDENSDIDTTPSDSDTTIMLTSNFVLTTQISTLYSSDNYTFISSESESTKTPTLLDKLKEALNNIRNNNSNSNDENSNEENNNIVVSDSTSFVRTLSLEKSTYTKKISKSNLLSTQNFVEAPTILLYIGGVMIGGYGNYGDKYPNYIQSMTIQKVSGKINTYTISLIHQIRFGEDPNFIDKLISKTGYTTPISILYGDSMNSSNMYRDDQAVITNVSFNENIASHLISYTITATSSIMDSVSTTKSYSSKKEKPSTLIFDLFYKDKNVSSSLLNSFPGMKNKSLVESNNLIPTNDAVVEVQSVTNKTPLEMLNYYVSGMYNPNNSKSTYILTYHDDTQNKFGGAYISIDEIQTTSSETLYGNYYEVYIGYSSDENENTNNFVTNFSINSDTYFPLVYKYNNTFSRYDYDIDNEGKLISTSTNPLISNNDFHKKNVIQSNWWKKVTEYPITATLTIRGLMRSVVLASYIKVNVLFYGANDLATGLYVVTGQTDSISGNGYTTTLELLRVGNI